MVAQQRGQLAVHAQTAAHQQAQRHHHADGRQPPATAALAGFPLHPLVQPQHRHAGIQSYMHQHAGAEQGQPFGEIGLQHVAHHAAVHHHAVAQHVVLHRSGQHQIHAPCHPAHARPRPQHQPQIDGAAHQHGNRRTAQHPGVGKILQTRQLAPQCLVQQQRAPQRQQGGHGAGCQLQHQSTPPACRKLQPSRRKRRGRGSRKSRCGVRIATTGGHILHNLAP